MDAAIKQEKSITVGGKELKLSTGELAKQAGGSVVVRYGETVVLGTATMGNPLSADADFMPLLVDYEEKFYAAGKIKGSRFIKREGRPTDEAVLNARLIDRAIRPLFPKDMINDIQVVLTILSYDGENDPDIPAIVAACAALTVSDVPWNGPLAGVRVGRVGGQFVINPNVAQREQSTLDLIVAGTADRVAMIEAGAQELPEGILLNAIDAAQASLGLISPVMEELQKEAGKQKREPIFMDRDGEGADMISEIARPILADNLRGVRTKEEFGRAENDTVAAVVERLSEAGKEKLPSERTVRNVVHELHGEYQRRLISEEQRRADGRSLTDIRPLAAKVGLLPRTHGSGLFQRGETQILTTVTLGGPSDVLLLDTMEIEAKKRYIHYYNFPAFSVGEIKPSRGPGRREIGHGALAERALIPVLPDHNGWPPYTMLLVSEVLESHGSSSMASVCGSSLALMDAGVPIKRPVAGIAMGLITGEDGKYQIVTDIAGLEDEKGDMDLKAAGTKEGITALQMDVKVTGLNRAILSQALGQAREARLKILDTMAKTIAKPRSSLSPYAPRILTLRIPVEKIGDLIGPKGKHVNEIIEETGVDIDIEDDGLVSITSSDEAAMTKAEQMVRNLTREIKPGEYFEGRVTRLMDFGAFVELVPGVDGMVHISQFRDQHVDKITDVVNVGDMIKVVVTEIDHMGRINLSHKAALAGKGKDNHAGRGYHEGERNGSQDRPGPTLPPEKHLRGPKPPSRGD